MSQADATDTTTTSRRLFLRHGSAVAVFGALATAAASEADPIFAAIERHKKAFSDYEGACKLTDTVAARNDGREITANDEAEFEAASEAEEAALDDLLTLAPITRAGARAALEYIGDMDADECLVGFAETLRNSPVLAG